MVVYKIKPDGVCGPRCAALWLTMDQSLGYVLGGVINDNFRNDWHFYKGFFSFPFKAIIGSGKEEIFDTEEGLLEFFKTNKSAFLWRGDEDFAVICSIYKMKIKIYKPDGQLTVIEPRIGVPSPIGIPDGKVDDMLILYDESHYDLIVPRDGTLATVGGLDFRRSEKSRLTDEETTVAECINEDECKETNEKDDISKEATIKSLKHQIGRLNLEKEKLLKKNELDKEKLKKEEKKNEILQRKLDALGVNVSKTIGGGNNYDKVDLETFSSEDLVTRERGDRGLRQYKCKLCSEIFKTKLQFNKHNTDCHSQAVQSQKQYNCSVCSHESESAIEQLKHAESSRHKPVMVTQKCFTCGNSFSGIESLMKHRREAHPSSKKCKKSPLAKLLVKNVSGMKTAAINMKMKKFILTTSA